MKKRIFTTFCLGAALLTGAYAQEKTDNSSSFKPGWYIGINGGTNFFMGEGNNFFSKNKDYVDPWKKFGWLGRVAVGYDFTPVIGLRGMLGYHAFNWTTVPVAADGSYPVYKFSSENLSADMMVNLSNWWGGYKKRTVDFSAFVGLGGAYLNDNSVKASVAGMFRGGLQSDLHLSDAVSINLMLDGNISTDNYNDLTFSPSPVDIFPELTLGLTYRIPSKEKQKEEPAEEKLPTTTTPKEEPAKTDVKPVEEKPAETKPVEKPAETKPVTTAPAESKPETKEVMTRLNEHIFFAQNKRDITGNEHLNSMQKIAEFVKQHPDTRIIVSGYADRTTGVDDANNQVSKERAVNVANKLIREYGVPYKNIWVKWYGSGIQPYLSATKNRLVIVRSPDVKVLIPLTETKGVEKKNDEVENLTPAPADTLSKYSNEGPLFQVVHFKETITTLDEAKQKDVLKAVAAYLKRHPDARIAISGYADKASVGEKKNAVLSKERAINVANALINEHAISSGRIQVKWFGAQKENGTQPSMNKLVLIETIQ